MDFITNGWDYLGVSVGTALVLAVVGVILVALIKDK